MSKDPDSLICGDVYRRVNPFPDTEEYRYSVLAKHLMKESGNPFPGPDLFAANQRLRFRITGKIWPVRQQKYGL